MMTAPADAQIGDLWLRADGRLFRRVLVPSGEGWWEVPGSYKLELLETAEEIKREMAADQDTGGPLW